MFLHWGHFLTQLNSIMKTTYPTHPMRDFNEWITAVHNYFRMTATEYVNNLYVRKYTPFRIEADGKKYYIVFYAKQPVFDECDENDLRRFKRSRRPHGKYGSENRSPTFSRNINILRRYLW